MPTVETPATAAARWRNRKQWLADLLCARADAIEWSRERCLCFPAPPSPAASRRQHCIIVDPGRITWPRHVTGDNRVFCFSDVGRWAGDVTAGYCSWRESVSAPVQHLASRSPFSHCSRTWQWKGDEIRYETKVFKSQQSVRNSWRTISLIDRTISKNKNYKSTASRSENALEYILNINAFSVRVLLMC